MKLPMLIKLSILSIFIKKSFFKCFCFHREKFKILLREKRQKWVVLRTLEKEVLIILSPQTRPEFNSKVKFWILMKGASNHVEIDVSDERIHIDFCQKPSSTSNLDFFVKSRIGRYDIVVCLIDRYLLYNPAFS